VTGGRNSGDLAADIAHCETIKAMYESLGNVDALRSTAGEAKWAALESLTENHHDVGF
jgi:hypothetical protein